MSVEHKAIMPITFQLFEMLLHIPDDVKVVDAYNNPGTGNIELLLSGNVPDGKNVRAIYEQDKDGVRFVRWEVEP